MEYRRNKGLYDKISSLVTTGFGDLAYTDWAYTTFDWSTYTGGP